MNEHSVSRTLVKSPPELWAELSDPAALSRHLGELGEITITRLEPEHTVAWEGERARGTVELEPAGWGTKVTLEATGAAEPDVGPEEPRAEVAPPVPAPAPPAVVAAPPADEALPEGVPPAEEVPAEPAPRPGFLARLLGRFRRPEVEAEMEEEPPSEVMATEEPLGEPAVAEEPPADDGLPAVLAAALDALGSAHHRPFSRG